MLDLAGVPDAVRRGGRGTTLIVIRLGAMGDVLRTVPVVRLLRRGLPEASIHWIAESTWTVVLADHPDLDGCVALPRAEWRRLVRRPTRWAELARGVAAFRRRLRDIRPDVALDFHGNLRSGVVLGMSGAPIRLGHSGHQQKEGNRLFTTHRVPAGERRRSRIERGLDLVRALGLADGPLPPCELPLARAGAAEAARIAGVVAGGRGFAVAAPGASARQAYKKPPPELLAEACRRLRAHDLRTLVIWGPGEEEDARQVAALAPGDATLAPATSLATLAGLLATARLFVGGDSGPLHLACATGCPVVGLYGPTDPEVNRPWGVPFERVWPEGRDYTGIKRVDREAGGFDGLTAAAVGDAVDRLLGRLDS